MVLEPLKAGEDGFDEVSRILGNWFGGNPTEY